MKKALLAVGAAALVATSAPAGAQSTTNNLTTAVANTLYAACTRSYAAAACAGLMAGAQAALAATNPARWSSWFDQFSWPSPTPLAGASGGGGASGMWCSDFAYAVDAVGDLIVPAFPMTGGGPISDEKPPAGYVTPNTWGGGSTDRYASGTLVGAAIYSIHNKNMGTQDKRGWVGVWKVTGGQVFAGRSKAYFNASGQLINQMNFNVTVSAPAQWTLATNRKPCPISGDGGADFDFLAYGPATTSELYKNCLMYAKNYSLSSSGYAYSDTTVIKRNEIQAYLDSMKSQGFCNLNADVIGRIAEELWQEAYDKDKSLPPPKPVEPQDVRSAPVPPTVEDVLNPPGELPPGDPSAPAPTPTATPSPTPSSGPDFTDPGVGPPTLEQPPTGLLDPVFDWLPDLPSIDINVGAGACPTWQMQPFPGPEWNLTLESHCPFMEDNRAALSALFLTLFTIGAALIILRA